MPGCQFELMNLSFYYLNSDTMKPCFKFLPVKYFSKRKYYIGSIEYQCKLSMGKALITQNSQRIISINTEVLSNLIIV